MDRTAAPPQPPQPAQAPAAPAAEAPQAAPAPSRRHRALRRLRGYFLTGVLVTAPIGFTLWLSWNVLVFVDDKVKLLIPDAYLLEFSVPFKVPGFGLVALALGLTLIGMLAAGLIGRTLIRVGEEIVGRMPVLRGVYAASKQVIETVIGHNATSFREVVLVEFPRKECWAVGFVTGVAGGEIGRFTRDDAVNVFIPTTPNPTSGYLVFVPRRDVVTLSMTVEDGIKLVVSGGIVAPPDPSDEKPRKKRVARTFIPRLPLHEKAKP
ncbi:MAG: DUF502 domain-containing protein [Rhodospirillales bacterium]